MKQFDGLIAATRPLTPLLSGDFRERLMAEIAQLDTPIALINIPQHRLR